MEALKQIGIVGGGKMGNSIFTFLCNFDFEITWYIRTETGKARNKHQRKLKRLLKNKLITQVEFNKKLQKQGITNSINDLANCDFIIECISEDLTNKQKLVKELFSIINKETIIASNSSSITPDLLIENEENKSKLIGLHFFYPVSIKNIVEFISTKYNTKHTIEKTEQFLSTINKFVLKQSGQNSFLLNRLMLHLQAAAFNLQQDQNFSFTQIDSAVDKHLFPIGIFAMMDSIGLDIIYESAMNYIEYEENKEPFIPLINSLQKHIAESKLGAKTNVGFINYNKQKSTDSISDFDQKQIATSLANSYFSSYNWYIEKGMCKPSNLTFSMNEYLDTDTGKWSDIHE